MKKRTIAAGLLTLLSVVTLAACSKTSESSKIVTMKGDTVTVGDIYDQLKGTPTAQQTTLNILISRVFEKQYKGKVSDKQVEEAYNNTVKSYGGEKNFLSAISQQNYTKETYKQYIRAEKLVEYASKQEAQKELTTANYKSAYKDYNPEVTVQLIQMDDESKAKSVLDQAKADGADFEKLAKDNSKTKKTEYTFDSGSTNIPDAVSKAAFSLKKGEVSDLITTADYQSLQQGQQKSLYYIIKVTSKADKNANWKAYKSRLKEIILNQKINNATFRNAVIGKAFKKANVKVKDKTMNDIITRYAKAADTSASTTTTKSEATTANSDKTTEASTDSQTTAAE
ncbi:peptidyl-prolyl cis-trans isomerase [Streptococcus macacae]|uniref:Foldase protein PrsA n=1 Tax=Streptococcus macacae NCTC 11558 TaxID=764298 RepID=G5JUT4_9STRE|nr:peptidyl-prolyl cis-trans isomerase [Streptococcus macacae]EHJ52841.1 PPIC-type PPIASE domain protein [Streptococcus macacae NCTC 11558]SUN78899.1 foldase protein PrsA [Streptococcus macacae NCTC 11558]